MSLSSSRRSDGHPSSSATDPSSANDALAAANDAFAAAVSETRTLVVKVGTRVLTGADGGLDRSRIEDLADGICRWLAAGRHAVLISSGAVAAGVAKLGLPCRPEPLADLQAVAAIGQADLIQAYEEAFAKHGRHAAQVLLTTEDLRSRTGYLNVRNALFRIHDYRAVAVINENDSVAVAELMTTFGDNDRLASEVAGLFEEPLLVVLSDVDGLFDGPPESPSSRKIDVVKCIDQNVREMAIPHESNTSRGGMRSKLDAAATVNAQGHAVIIAPGKSANVLSDLLDGKVVGTLFESGDRTVRGRRRWIAASAAVAGEVHLDAGAVRAIADGGASLLAVGITRRSGNFGAGDVVAIVDPNGIEVARGLTNYDSASLDKILGLSRDRIAEVLCHRPHDSVIHRDNLSWTANATDALSSRSTQTSDR